MTRQMVRLPFMMPGTFVAIGAVEALASLLGFLGAANLPGGATLLVRAVHPAAPTCKVQSCSHGAGVVLPLLAQTILLWQVLLAVTVLRKRLSVSQASGSEAADNGCLLLHRGTLWSVRRERENRPGLWWGHFQFFSSPAQVLGVGLVMGGVCLAAWPQGGGSPLDGGCAPVTQQHR